MSALTTEPELIPGHEHLELEPLEMPQSVSGRLGSYFTNRLRAWFGMPWDRRLAKAALMISSIRAREKEYLNLTDDELKRLPPGSRAGPAAARISTACCRRHLVWCASPLSARSRCGRSTCNSPARRHALPRPGRAGHR